MKWETLEGSFSAVSTQIFASKHARVKELEKCVQRLLEAGAEVDKATPFGTALSKAAEKGQEKCVELLLGAGAKVDQARNDGDTPLSIAAERGQENCAALLRAAGAKEVR